MIEAARDAVREAHAGAAAAAAQAPLALVPPPAEEPVPPPAAVPAPPPVPALRSLVVAVAPEVEGPARDVPALLRPAWRELVEAGIGERDAAALLGGLAQMVLPFAPVDADPRDLTRRWLADRLPVVRQWRPRPGGRVVALVGQAGVGKSTTAAKLAARHAAAGRGVALVALGPGPHPALETHAERLGLEAYEAADARTLERALDALRQRDLVVLDTAGLSHADADGLADLGRLVGAARPDEIHLVVPVTVAPADVPHLARAFRAVGVNRVTMTKLDETRYHGNLVTVPLRAGRPIAYLADGPTVPDAIAPADGERIARLLLP